MDRRREAETLRLYGDLVRIVHAINQRGARELRGHGLTPAQYQLLRLADAEPDCSQQRIVERLGVSKGNVSMLVTRLEDAGLLARIPDGAAYSLRVTDGGRATLARIRPLHAQFLTECFARLDDGQLADLAELLALIDPAA